MLVGFDNSVVPCNEIQLSSMRSLSGTPIYIPIQSMLPLETGRDG